MKDIAENKSTPFPFIGFFWNREYPTRSFTRIFILVSATIYIWGRIVDPGPDWVRELIGMLIHTFNLEFMQQITFAAPAKPTLWTGSGFALQLQLLFTWPLVWVFTVIAGWMNRNGSKEFNQPIIKVPSFRNWMLNLFVVLLVLVLGYFPFSGSDVTKVQKLSSFPFSGMVLDNYTTSIFWMLAAWLILTLGMTSFYVIKTEFKLTFKKDN